MFGRRIFLVTFRRQHCCARILFRPSRYPKKSRYMQTWGPISLNTT